MQLTKKQISGLYTSCTEVKQKQEVAERYYKGRQAVPELAELRVDGRVKTQQKTNYTRYIIDNHTSFMLNNPIKYVLRDGNTNAAALSQLDSIYEANSLHQLDLLNMRNVLLYGYSVEVHSFDGKTQVVSSTEPDDWAFARDHNGNIIAAVYKVDLEKNTFYNGAFIEQKVRLYYVYDAEEVVVYSDGEKEVKEESRTPHNYGRLPLTIYVGNDEMQPLLDCAFYNCVDMLDIVGSSAIDSLKYDTDSMLYLTGYKIDKLLQKDEQGVSNIVKLREMNILTGTAEQDAKFLEKKADVEKFRFAYDNLQNNLFLMGYCPNIISMLAKGLSEVSGTALRIAYGIQLAKATEVLKYFEKGLRDRISLLNVISGFFKLPTLDNYNIVFEVNMPNNNVEMLQYLPSLEGVLSTQDKIKLLSFVDRPSEAYSNLLAEKGLTVPAKAEGGTIDPIIRSEIIQ